MLDMLDEKERGWSEMERTCCCNLTIIETALFVFEKKSFRYVPTSLAIYYVRCHGPFIVK